MVCVPGLGERGAEGDDAEKHGPVPLQVAPLQYGRSSQVSSLVWFPRLGLPGFCFLWLRAPCPAPSFPKLPCCSGTEGSACGGKQCGFLIQVHWHCYKQQTFCESSGRTVIWVSVYSFCMCLSIGMGTSKHVLSIET